MKDQSLIKMSLSENGVLTLRLNRSRAMNALNIPMLREFSEALKHSRHNPNVRVVKLLGGTRVFCAGADLEMMLAQKECSIEENLINESSASKVGALLADVFYQLWSFPKPTVAVVEGAAMGGGAGLVAACDVAIASTKAIFGFPEARLGLIPAVISPYVIRAIGQRHATRLFLTGEKFSAEEALRIGLASQVIDPTDIESVTAGVLSELLACGPEAQASAKCLVQRIEGEAISVEQSLRLSQEIDNISASAEACHGIQAHLNKETPDWINE